MHTEIIKADTIDEAVKRILQELKEDNDTGSVQHNVICFDGWDGLGASAVLRAVGQRLSTGQEFSRIIHIDCSKWESRRAVQRALVVQLKLPAHVIGMFDAQDEEDDYRGLGQGSRHEIPKVSREIYEHVQKQLGQRFLVIFNNGSCEEIDLESFGFPLSGYSRNKALWSFQGGFRLYPRVKVDKALESKTASSTDVFLSATSSNIEEKKLSNILHHEAEEVALGMLNNTGGIDWPVAAAHCFWYTMVLGGMGGHLIDYDLATHVCNYWICDVIIQQQGDVAAADTLWLSFDALKREMRLDAEYYQSPQLPASPVARRLQGRMPYWTSPYYGSTLIHDERDLVPKGMFQQYDMLRVLKLSACTFSHTLPPFLCCHNLRFLWLDHCREDENSSTDDGAANEEDIQQCFQKLWVLDVRYSSSKFLSEKMMDFMTQLRELHVMGQEEFDMDMLQGRLHNIRKLRVTKSKTNCSKRAYLLSGKDKMEHLELSGNGGNMKSLSVESSSCSSLETVIIDGCVSLEEILLKGWVKPGNSLLLRGSFPNLHSLDLTGAAVKTLDLSAVMAPKLDELFLLHCVKLTAILWLPPPPSAGEGKAKRYSGKLHIDTTQREDTTAADDVSPDQCGWYIYVGDARLLGSLEPVKDYFDDNDVHLLDISTRMPSSSAAGSKPRAEVDQDNYYATTKADVAASGMQQQLGDDSAIIMSTCPPSPGVSSQGCYMHIEDTTDVAAGGNERIITIPGFICDVVKILHVHDSLFVTRISLRTADSESKWDKLEWCRVERCPRLEHVFSSTSEIRALNKLRTIWASHLTKARYVMAAGRKGRFGGRYRILGYEYLGATYYDPVPSFSGLTSLHLYHCPRLVSAVPLLFRLKAPWAFPSLETLEIMWCGDLREVFEATASAPKEVLEHGVVINPRDVQHHRFSRLKHIRLHGLPNLCSIMSWGKDEYAKEYWGEKTYAPNLETIQIRGCCGLRELPVVGGNKVVSCDCEKDWWDKLKWYSDMQRSHYKPIHSQHYKKTFIWGSALR